MLPTYWHQPHSGPRSRELPTCLNSGSSFLHSPPPSPPKATPVQPPSCGAVRDSKKPSKPSAPSAIQTEIVSPENPSSFSCQSLVPPDAPLSSSSRISGLTPNATGLPTPRPSLELPKATHPLTDDVASSLDSPLSSPSRVSGLMDPNATGLPTPRPLLELPAMTHPLAIDDVASTLKPLSARDASVEHSASHSTDSVSNFL